MGLREAVEYLRGDVLEESWSQIRRLFPGVKEPLFRAVDRLSSAQGTIRDGFISSQKSIWGGEEKTEKGVSFTRDFGLMESGTFGPYVFVADKAELRTKYKVGPVLSPGALDMGTPGHVVSREALPDISIGDYKSRKNPELEERVFTTKDIPPRFIKGIVLVNRSATIGNAWFAKDGEKLWLLPIGPYSGVSLTVVMALLSLASDAGIRMIVKDPDVVEPRKPSEVSWESTGTVNLLLSEYDVEKGYYPIAGFLGMKDFDRVRKTDEWGHSVHVEYKGKVYTGYVVSREVSTSGRINLPV